MKIICLRMFLVILSVHILANSVLAMDNSVGMDAVVFREMYTLMQELKARPERLYDRHQIDLIPILEQDLIVFRKVATFLQKDPSRFVVFERNNEQGKKKTKKARKKKWSNNQDNNTREQNCCAEFRMYYVTLALSRIEQTIDVIESEVINKRLEMLCLLVESNITEAFDSAYKVLQDRFKDSFYTENRYFLRLLSEVLDKIAKDDVRYSELLEMFNYINNSSNGNWIWCLIV